MELPDKLGEKLFEAAEIAKFTSEQIQSYEDSLKYYRDLKNSLDTAREEKALEIAKELLRNSVDIEVIANSTGLTREQVERLK